MESNVIEYLNQITFDEINLWNLVMEYHIML